MYIGGVAREEMTKSKLPNSVLRRIWALSDMDVDGMLDRDEFAVAMFLIDHKLSGNDLPEQLPDCVIPPNKRSLMKKSNSSPATRVANKLKDCSEHFAHQILLKTEN